MSKRTVIAVDLDGTLAHYDRWRGVEHIGAPITAMVERVQRASAAGIEICILTARVAPRDDGSHIAAAGFIREWCCQHLGWSPRVTYIKRPDIDEIWDDKAVGVEKNTGRLLSPSLVMKDA